MILFKLETGKNNKNAITTIANHLSVGKIAAIPTETFYALSTNPFHEKSVKKIYSLKKRSADKPILLLVPNKEEALRVVGEAPSSFEPLIDAFWPGPLTLVMKKSQQIPAWIDSHTGKIALRIPGNALTLQILGKCSFPLTGTSANRSGEAPLTSDEGVLRQFGPLLDLLVMGGSLPGGLPSTLLDLTEDKPLLLREGRIKREEIERILMQKVIVRP